MKLLRFGERGQEKPGCLDTQGKIRDLSSVISDVSGTVLSKESLARLSAVDLSGLPIVAPPTRLGACVGSVGNFVAVGLNYVDHAKETNSQIPAEPILFNKHTSCIVGPNDPVTIPRGSEKTDWEAEIAFVVGEAAFEVPQDEAMDYVAGFCVCLDVSERAFQSERGGQWTKGKSAPTFGPLGPWLVTKDEIEDVQNLGIWLDVNGQRHDLLDRFSGLLYLHLHASDTGGCCDHRDTRGRRPWTKPAGLSEGGGRCRTRRRRSWKAAPVVLRS